MNRKWLMSIALLIVFSQSGHAQTWRYWQNTGGGLYSDGANWVGGAAPLETESASFASNATYTVTLTGDTKAVETRFDASTSAGVTLNLAGYNWTNTIYLHLGYLGKGNALTITGGGRLYGNYIANGYSGSLNRFLVQNGTLTANGHIFQGLNVGANGNQMVVDGVSARVETKNFDLTVGENGNNNSLIVTNGATVYSARDIGFGGTPGAAGSGQGNWGHVTGTGTVAEAAASFIVGYNTTNNYLTIDNGGRVRAVNGYVGSGAGAISNHVLISGGAWTNSVTYFGVAGAHDNSITIDHDGALVTLGYLWFGHSAASNNTLEVRDGKVTGLHVIIGNTAGANANHLLVDGSNAVLNTVSYDVTVGPNGSYNKLTVANGGYVYSTRNAGFGGQPHVTGNGCYNEGLVTGIGSLMKVEGEFYVGGTGACNSVRMEDGGAVVSGAAYIGSAAGADSNQVHVAGGIWTNTTLTVGKNSTGNRLRVSDAGRVYGSGNSYLGQGGIGNGITVENGTCQINNALYIGYTGGTNNNVTVSGTNGFLIINKFDIAVGTSAADQNSFGDGNALIVTNGATARFGRALYVGGNGGMSNVITVGVGSILDSTDTGNYASFVVGTNVGNRIVNVGGVYQFATDTPTMTPGTFGWISIQDGTLSFRAITDADVLCTGPGKRFDSTTKMAYSGENAFRLDNATNLANQAYTFDNVSGADHFARLDLFNGSRYRGAITIGSGGTLSLYGGGSSTDSTLTLQSGARMLVDLTGTNAYSSLDVTGSVNLGNATLEVTCREAPVIGYAYKILSTTAGLGGSTFGTPSVDVEYGGKSILMSLRYVGNDVFLVPNLRGTVVILE